MSMLKRARAEPVEGAPPVSTMPVSPWLAAAGEPHLDDPAVANIDRAGYHPAATQLRQQLSHRDFAGIDAFMAEVTDPAQRIFYVEALSNWDGQAGFLDHWVEQSPEQALPWLVRGAQRVHHGWAARGNGLTVSEASVPAFLERLRVADRDLSRAAHLDRVDPTAYVMMLRISKGRGDEAPERDLRWQLLRERDPLNRRGHDEWLAMLCSRWYGSQEAMFGFAHAVAGGRPDGDPLQGLVLWAHCEAWLASDAHGPRAYDNPPSLCRADIARDIHIAIDRAIRRAPRADMALVDDLNAAAFLCSLMGDWVRARELFDQLGDRPTQAPWGYCSPAADACRGFLGARAMARG